MIRQVYMLADGSRDNSGSLLFGFGNDEFSHDVAVIIVQMADRLIQEKEIERLAKCADEGDTLLLSEREFAGFDVYLIRDTQLFEECQNLLFLLAAGKVILQLHILESGKLGEDAKILKKHTQ